MTVQQNLPAPSHLYTWVDVDEHFTRMAVRGEWAPWLLEVDAYWDSVELTVAEGTASESVWAWLAERLGPLTVDSERQAILLESLDSDGDGDALVVHLQSAQAPIDVARQPRWSERRIVQQLADGLPAPQVASFPHDVQICAFHSFKGGVGRTLHCVALARELAERGHNAPGAGQRVLLVDADLEAPGISWMVAAQGSRLDFALDDFLALLHGSASGDRGRVIALARKFLVNQEQDGIIVLPTTRDNTRVGPPRIEPVDLLAHDRPPYILTEALAELAHEVGADTVLIDLRAGTSELSAPILLDPRVHRVFVTTISDQSVQGTTNLLHHLAHRAPSRRLTDPACTVLLTQFQEKEHSAELTKAATALMEAVSQTVYSSPDASEAEDEVSAVDRDVTSEPLSSPFLAPLLALPRGWSDVCEKIERTTLRSVVSALADSVRPLKLAAPEPTLAALRKDPQGTREALAKLAERLTYAETAEVHEDFLPTEALINLVSTHRTEAPVEVVVGAKGSGKTFTYLRMCRQGTWDSFGVAAGVEGIELRAPLVPVLASTNLADGLRNQVEDVQRESAAKLTGAEPASFLSLRDLVTEALDEDMNEVGWRRVWLTCLARAAGIDATPETAESALTDLARRHRAIFVIDGLEDLFQDFSSNTRQQRALRALLTGCPDWLRSLRGRPLGLVVFVRRDLVLNSVQQNAQQFLERHHAYSLRWNRTEALRLVAWVGRRAGVLDQDESVDIYSASPKNLSRLLIQMWGQKLGSDKSREARSEEWFLAALSDFNLQIQARDIVYFLAKAASDSAADEKAGRWADRLLTPSSMRKALPQSSREKISAIELENVPVRTVFGHLRSLPEEARKIPFTLESVQLDSTQARLLEANGVLFRDNDQYWMPEIYRHGLGFGVSNVGRPRVVSITKLIRDRSDSV
ncbi:ParA family protein [Streptomyces sp. NPDC018711]|uniref:ParA family protein n=1 Tax=Streptomyces sp. NPDC018711 TaxID=3365052 RepID=UPI003796CCD3